MQPRQVSIPVDGATLTGDLAIPPGATGVVIFAHGSGSSRLSSRNRYVASVLQTAGMGTLLFDLLTSEEERQEQYTRHLRFDIELLAGRLTGATRWLQNQLPMQPSSRIGYFGASTGGGAAIVAAAHLGAQISAVVSRGGRPDLAGPALPLLQAPTLLIVGEDDEAVLQLNREAMTHMNPGIGSLVTIPGATHLFEESGALEKAADVACRWFLKHLIKP